VVGIVSHPEDPHAERVMGHLRAAGQDAVLLDLSDLPDRATITIDYRPEGPPRLEYSRTGGSPIDLAKVGTMWWRRPQQASPSAVTDPDVRLFTLNEWQEAINGLWQLIPAVWVNHPVRDEVAARKALQLRTAREVGLRVPRTLVTSDPGHARAFIDANGPGGTVYKTFSCTHDVWRETRKVHEEDLALLDSVRLAPTIFQEFVPAEADLRITVIGPHVFPAAIRFPETDRPVDFRMNLGRATVEAVELPAKVAKGLRSLMSRFGLVYGAVDMRKTPDGDYVFLEVNTAGEFLFIEERTGQPIARTLAGWLAGAR
jgi:glutathione synthase/RimK-type ligase-like ATP-grasp enzyme